MEEFIKVVIDNGITVGVVIYFMIIHYKFFEKITETLTKICENLDDIEQERKKG